MNNNLEYEDIKTALHKWAFYFIYERNFDGRFEYWELINEAWFGVRKLPKDKIQFASARIKWDMLHYIRSQIGHNNRPVKRTWLHNLYKNSLDITTCYQFLPAKTEHSNYETEDFFNNLPLSSKNIRILKLKFIDDLYYFEIGKIIGMSCPGVFLKIKNILKKLRCLSGGDIWGLVA